MVENVGEAPAPQNQAQAGTPFALNPGHALSGQLDFSTTEGRKLYSYATASIYGSSEDHFDCSASGLHSFLKELGRRARQYGWDISVCEVPKAINDQGGESLVNLITNHGELTLEQIQAFEKTYIFGQSRAAQDTHMLYHCIMNSLSKAGKEKVHLWESDYMIKEAAPSNRKLESGPALLKVVLRESHLDTKATVSSIRENLTDLPHYIGTVSFDIEKFNSHVMMLMEGLRARGEKSDDLLNNLFKAYGAVQDTDFTSYIKRLNDRYLEEVQEFTPEELMGYASNKYKTLVLQNKWNAPSPEQEQIQALQAKLSKLEKARRIGNERKGGKHGGGGKGKKGGDKNGKKRSADKELPKWMYQRPKDSELKKPRTYEGKEWYYCSHETGGKCDGIYRRHKPGECRGTGKQNPYKHGGNNGDKNPSKKIKVEQAIANLSDDESVGSN